MLSKSIDRNVDTNSELIVRPAELADTKEIGSILANSFYNFPEFASWIYPCLQFTIGEDLRYRLRSHSPLYCCLVAKLIDSEDNTAIAGTAEITLRSPSFWSNKPQYLYISNLAVKKNYRRRGVASELLRKCEQIALDWGYQETHLHVLETNKSAKQLYLNNDYKICQVESDWTKFWLNYSTRLLLKKQIQLS